MSLLAGDVAFKHLPSMPKALGSIPSTFCTGVAAHICNPSTQRVEADVPKVQDQLSSARQSVSLIP